MTYDKRSTYIGFIRGSIYFLDGSLLHLREFINAQLSALPTFPHHKHEGNESNIVSASPPDIQAVLVEIQGWLAAPAP